MKAQYRITSAPIMPLMPDGAGITDWAENLDANTGLTLAGAAERVQQISVELMMNTTRMPQAPSVVMDVLSAFMQGFKKFIEQELHGSTHRHLLIGFINEFEAEHPMALAFGDPASMSEIREKARQVNPN